MLKVQCSENTLAALPCAPDKSFEALKSAMEKKVSEISVDQHLSQNIHSSQAVVEGPLSVDGRNKHSVRAPDCSSESMLKTVKISKKLDLSEVSPLRDVHGSATPSKAVHSECSMEQQVSSEEKVFDHDDANLEFTKKKCVSVDPETASDNGKTSAIDSSNSPMRNEFTKCNAPITSAPTRTDNDASDDLIDVRICDICGDVGREAMLVLCSKCSDGAEHIYCMRINMDKVPEGDWLCEDCAMMQEPKRPKQTEVERFDIPSKEECQGLSTMNSNDQQVREMGMGHSGKDSSLSGMQHNSGVEVSLSPKRRRLAISGKPVTSLRGSIDIPVKSSGSGGKMKLARVSSMKEGKEVVHPIVMGMEKERVRRAYSFGDKPSKKVLQQAFSSSGHKSGKPGTVQEIIYRQKSYNPGRKPLVARISSLKINNKGKDAFSLPSPSSNCSARKLVKQQCLSAGRSSPKPQSHFHRGGGDLCKVKSNNISKSKVEVQQSHGKLKPERRISKESFCQLKKKFPEKKLLKSISLGRVCMVPSKMSDSHVSHTSNVKYSKSATGKKLTKKYDSVEDKSLVQDLPVPGSSDMKDDASRSTLCSEIVNALFSLKNNNQYMSSTQGNERSEIKEVDSSMCEDRNSSHALAGSVRDNISSAHLNNGISSSAKNMDSCPDGRTSDYMPKVEIQQGPDNPPQLGSSMVSPDDLHATKELPKPVVLHGISAVPESDCSWKGAFGLEEGGKLPKDCSGIQAHLSTCASSNVLELVRKFCPKILFKEVPRMNIWPIQFQRDHPMEQDIAVYFFAEDLQSYSRSYNVLLEGMVKNDLALEANFGDDQFLVFPSNLLPPRLQRWNTLSFLWGVFRRRKVDNGSSLKLSINVATLKPGFESADQRSFQSSASTKTMDHNGDHDVSSMNEGFSSQGLPSGDASPVADDCAEKDHLPDSVLTSVKFQKGDVGKNPNLSRNELDKINMVSLAFDNSKLGIRSYGNHKSPLPNLRWSYDYFSKFWGEKWVDVASWSSASNESGPCGSSDEGQVEQLHTPLSHQDVNLDLCLWSGSRSGSGSGLGSRSWSEAEADAEVHQVELDLALGFGGVVNKQVEKQGMMDGSSDGKISLDLSL